MLLPAMLLVLSAPATLTPPPAAPPSASGPHHFGHFFISPMGEPFTAEHGDALADWFQQADRNHDGQILVDEMEQDAERFFGVLDANHDGEIDPDEITHYETVIAPDGPRLSDMGFGGPSGGPRGRHRRDRGNWGISPEVAMQGRTRFGLLDLREPVATADTNFNRGVSLDEFRAAAAKRFSALDVDHQGRLTLEILEDLRPPPPPRQKKDPDAPSDIDANADTSPG